MSDQLEFNTKPESGVCHACGAKIVEYPYRFDATLKGFLLKLAGLGGKAHKDQLVLNHSEYAQACRVRYWGLAKMIDEGGREVIKGGLWQMTELGHEFVRGRIVIPKTVWVCRNQRTRASAEGVFIHEVLERPKRKRFYKDVAKSQIK